MRKNGEGEFCPALAPRLKSKDTNDDSQDMATSDDELSLLVTSGNGILEFSPQKAGLDVTPANLDFGDMEKKQTTPATLSLIAGGLRVVLC